MALRIAAQYEELWSSSASRCLTPLTSRLQNIVAAARSDMNQPQTTGTLDVDHCYWSQSHLSQRYGPGALYQTLFRPGPMSSTTKVNLSMAAVTFSGTGLSGLITGVAQP